ncbi:FkbM family methyltransferase [Shimia haliotis]|uniref:Methyltransferase, FkbM family n=1 Tax=Shimia haliotis TaxID=1280847 RepID=A0A1I4AS86_9RHOB|nr:FkbM family methyltransferase [Shimia haliotis]SFK58516.1 methyltransferase, FkbM family [Shimia haliotis]
MTQSLRQKIESLAAEDKEEPVSLAEMLEGHVRAEGIEDRNLKTLRLIQAFRQFQASDKARFSDLDGLAAENPYYGIVPCRAAGVDFVMFCANDDVVARRYLWAGADSYEPKMVQRWVSWCREAQGDILDIGAYSGLMSLLAARCHPTNQVHLFEPLEAIAERANINVKLNGVSRRVDRHKIAASNVSGKQDIHIYRDPNFLATGASIDKKAGKDVFATHTIRTAKLDDDFAHLSPKVVKIDTEGHELAVIKGMMGLLTKHKPKLLIEVWQDTRDEVLSELKNLGYRLEQAEKVDAKVNNFFAE